MEVTLVVAVEEVTSVEVHYHPCGPEVRQPRHLDRSDLCRRSVVGGEHHGPSEEAGTGFTERSIDHCAVANERDAPTGWLNARGHDGPVWRRPDPSGDRSPRRQLGFRGAPSRIGCHNGLG